VIVGNPPYSVGQTSGNDNNANVKYAHLDRSIASTFAARSSATLKNSLYDSYIRAIRWSANRIGDAGLIGFVTNGGFVDANTADGLRKTLAEEFTDIYVYNLRGNQRTAGEQSRKEGGKVFGSGSRNTVAVTFLVKVPGATSGRATVHYRDIGDYLTREEKLRLVDDASIDSLEWADIVPNDAGDWTNQRSAGFERWLSVAGEPGALFALHSGGLKTNRDSWVYNFSARAVRENVTRMVEFYNHEVARIAAQSALGGANAAPLEEVVNRDPTRISWSSSLLPGVARGKILEVAEEAFQDAVYRPFVRQRAYRDRSLVDRPGQASKMFPDAATRNPAIVFPPPGSSAPAWFCFAVDGLVDNGFVGVSATTVLPLNVFVEVESGVLDLDGRGEAGMRPRQNLAAPALSTLRLLYGSHLGGDDAFAFVYGMFHSPEYRSRFAADLRRSLPRIPRIETADFAAFAEAGRRLLDLHINYEDADLYPLQIDGVPEGVDDESLFGALRVSSQMRWGKKGKEKDLSVLEYSSSIAIRGIPDDAHRYMLGSRSALEWIRDRYWVKTDKASGIVNDPNDWSRDVGNPRYILDLIAKVTTVSVETMKIVDSLPPLRIVED